MNRPMMWLASLALLLPGCLFYAYPTVSCTLPTSVGPNHDHIFAFRIDIADEQGCSCFTGPGRYRLSPLYIPPEGDLGLQAKLALDSGFYWNSIALVHQQHTRNTVRVRLYRAGYEVVEIKSWKVGQTIEWKEAADLEDREKAVDILVGLTGEGGFAGKDHPFAHLKPGSASREHRQALLFAAGEYEILSRALTQDPAKCESLEQKGKALRQLANH